MSNNGMSQSLPTTTFHWRPVLANHTNHTTCDGGGSGGGLLRNEPNSHVMLRPTAPPGTWQRLSQGGVCGLSLIGWSYSAVFEKLIPLWHDAQEHHDQQEDGLLSAELPSPQRGDLVQHEDEGSIFCSQGLQELHIVSTDLWLSTQFRSPFTLGADRVMGWLLSGSASGCPNLHTLSITRGCTKAQGEFDAFCQALHKGSVPNLTRLELLDAADVYVPNQNSSSNSNNNDENGDTAAVLNISILLQSLAKSSLPLLRILKVHLNCYQLGCLSLEAWIEFGSQYQHQLQELSLHMIQIEGGSFLQSSLSPTSSMTQKSATRMIPSIRYSHLKKLHLTFVDFDRHTTWEHFFHFAQHRGEMRATNENCSTHRHNNDLKNSYETCGLLTSSLQNLSLVCPSMTCHQYEALWSHLFLASHGSSNGNSMIQLKVLHLSMVGSLYRDLSLRIPTTSSAAAAHSIFHQSNGVNRLCQVHPILRVSMKPSLPHLLQCWQEQPPTRSHLVEFTLPIAMASRESSSSLSRTGSRRYNYLLDHETEYHKDWQIVQDVWNLYQSIAQQQQRLLRRDGCRWEDPIYHRRQPDVILETLLLLSWEDEARQEEEQSSSLRSGPWNHQSLECIFHLICFVGPTLIASRSMRTSTTAIPPVLH